MMKGFLSPAAAALLMSGMLAGWVPKGETSPPGGSNPPEKDYAGEQLLFGGFPDR